jgi:hypothetical protein
MKLLIAVWCVLVLREVSGNTKLKRILSRANCWKEVGKFPFRYSAAGVAKTVARLKIKNKLASWNEFQNYVRSDSKID